MQKKILLFSVKNIYFESDLKYFRALTHIKDFSKRCYIFAFNAKMVKATIIYTVLFIYKLKVDNFNENTERKNLLNNSLTSA